jgi:acetylornithine deacetylase/succinyl-diaminopimelate desuccinylase-like protein
LTVAVGHKGFSWIEIVAEGEAAHGSRPREGRDAIFRMGRVLARLEALDRKLQLNSTLRSGNRLATRVSDQRRSRTQHLSRPLPAKDGAENDERGTHGSCPGGG